MRMRREQERTMAEEGQSCFGRRERLTGGETRELAVSEAGAREAGERTERRERRERRQRRLDKRLERAERRQRREEIERIERAERRQRRDDRRQRREDRRERRDDRRERREPERTLRAHRTPARRRTSQRNGIPSTQLVQLHPPLPMYEPASPVPTQEELPEYREQFHKYLDLLSFDARYSPVLRFNKSLIKNQAHMNELIRRFESFRVFPSSVDPHKLVHIDDRHYDQMIPELIEINQSRFSHSEEEIRLAIAMSTMEV